MQNKEKQTPAYTGLFDDIEKFGHLLEKTKKYYNLTTAQILQGDVNKIRKV